jgi:predicted enzyme related to lactoylglutathione lyase
MTAHGRILWTELNTRDPEKAKAFYGAAFGWTFQAMPMGEDGTYWLATAEGAEQPTVGMFQMSGPYFDGVPDHWLTYFGVDDIDARLAALPGLGGQILRPAWDIPGVGRIAIVRGASGAGEGWMTPPPGMAR